MSDSVRPHRHQPTRLPGPWDSPGKNTGVGCHFLLQCVKVKVKSLSCVQLFVTLWTVAHQAPLSMGFSRQEYWRGLTCFLPGDLLHPGIQPASLSSLVLAGGFFKLVPPGKPSRVYMLIQLFLKPMNHFIKHSLSGYLKNLEIVMSFSNCELQTQMAWQLLLLVSWEP